LFESFLGYLKAAKTLVSGSKEKIRDGEVWIELNRFPGFFDSLFVLAEDRIKYVAPNCRRLFLPHHESVWVKRYVVCSVTARQPWFEAAFETPSHGL